MTRNALRDEMVTRRQYAWWRRLWVGNGGLLCGAYLPWPFLKGTRYSGLTFWGLAIGNWHIGVTLRTAALTTKTEESR